MKIRTLLLTAFIALALCGILFTGCQEPEPGPVDWKGPSPYEGDLLILQAYGSSSSAAGVSHSFVELYNTTNEAINLKGIGLYYADGTDAGSGNTNTNTEDGPWKRISLDGKSIPAGGSFLILGPKQSDGARYQIPNNYGDINDLKFTLSNRAFKVALIQRYSKLTVQNPFDTDGAGTKVAGYIDMVGAANEYQNRDLIFGFETKPARCSASEAIRRKDLTDSDDNRGVSSTYPSATGDFVSIRYATGSSSLTAEELAVRSPRNSVDTANGWNPFDEPADPPPGTAMLMILQANTYGNSNGGYASSLVELYNNTSIDIELNPATGDKYYLHIGGTADPGWTYVIPLTGTIPSYCSFLIRSTNDLATGNNIPPHLLPDADQTETFAIINDDFKVAVIKNHSAMLTVANPFDTDDAGTKITGYVDMLGVRNALGFETRAATATSRPQPVRRVSLTDTNDNREDFGQYDSRSTGVGYDQLYKYWPRNLSGGKWNPITGNVLPANTVPVTGPVLRGP